MNEESLAEIAQLILDRNSGSPFFNPQKNSLQRVTKNISYLNEGVIEQDSFYVAGKLRAFFSINYIDTHFSKNVKQEFWTIHCNPRSRRAKAWINKTIQKKSRGDSAILHGTVLPNKSGRL